MGKTRTIARRTFLVGSAAVAGGVVFGIYAVKKPHTNPLLAALGDDAASFNPWVRISSERVTLITPHADLGQGAVSMQAALIAEEMDLSWGEFDVDFGEPSAAYYNTATADEAIPFSSHDDGFAARTARSVVGSVIKVVGVMVTGGSTSVPDSFDKLRLAGAVARETLKLAAAKEYGVAVADLSTREGAVWLDDGSRISYEQLAATAADIEPVGEVSLRDPDQWRLLGKPMPRLDVPAKSNGQQTYGIDLHIDGMKHAAVRTNPRQGGGLRSFDAEKARNMPGVEKILEISNGFAVIANNTWNSFRAVNAIQAEWGPAPYPAEMDGHWSEIAASFTEERLDREWRHDGDVPAALAVPGHISAEYRAPYVAHQPLEPLNAIVRVNTDNGGSVEVWSGHQMPRFLQQRVAEVAGIDADDVVFHNQYVGGSFGHRLEIEFVAQATEIAMQLPGTPVKLTYTREEDFAHDFPRQIGMARGTGTVADGRVECFDLQVATVSAIASQMRRLGQPAPGPDGQIAAGAWNLPYAIPNFRMRAYRVPELAPTSSWRSVGASTQGFFADCFLDELIHAAGADPLEERLRLMNRTESRKVLEAVAEMSDWGSDPGPDRGRGVAFVDSFGVPTAEVVEVTNTTAGIRIDKVFVAADVGTIIDPVNFDNQVKGAVVWGLGHAMNCQITYAGGMAQQSNFHAHAGMRMHQCPEIHVRGLELATKIRGIGEPPVPPAAPALANAIFAATGRRLREMPFNKFMKFV
jgi:isoquinoline 1-oxidoreductase beta subunit